MNPRLWTPVAVIALLAVGGCKNEDDVNSKILPIRAAVSVNTVGDDPAVFLAKSSKDNSSNDDIVVLDLMLRMSLAQEIDSVALHIRFDPGIIQFMGFTQSPESDGQTFIPFGECNSNATYCAKYPAPAAGTPNPPMPTMGPLCLPTSIGNVNSTGDLLLGMAAIGASQCDEYDQGGTIKLLSLTFVASSEGTSPVTLVDQGGPGECDIIDNLTQHRAVPCVDAQVEITGYR